MNLWFNLFLAILTITKTFFLLSQVWIRLDKITCISWKVPFNLNCSCIRVWMQSQNSCTLENMRVWAVEFCWLYSSDIPADTPRFSAKHETWSGGQKEPQAHSRGYSHRCGWPTGKGMHFRAVHCSPGQYLPLPQGSDFLAQWEEQISTDTIPSPSSWVERWPADVHLTRGMCRLPTADFERHSNMFLFEFAV